VRSAGRDTHEPVVNPFRCTAILGRSRCRPPSFPRPRIRARAGHPVAQSCEVRYGGHIADLEQILQFPLPSSARVRLRRAGASVRVPQPESAQAEVRSGALRAAPSPPPGLSSPLRGWCAAPSLPVIFPVSARAQPDDVGAAYRLYRPSKWAVIASAVEHCFHTAGLHLPSSLRNPQLTLGPPQRRESVRA